MNKVFIILLCLINTWCFSQNLVSSNYDTLLNIHLCKEILDSSQKVVRRALSYLTEHQSKEDNLCFNRSSNCITYLKGEWPSYMEMKIRFPYLGGKKKTRDSNLFTTLAIHNALCDIMLLYPSEYAYLRDVIDLAFYNIMNYKNGCHFNFWYLLPPNKKLRFRDKKGYQPYVRRPTNFRLNTKFINNAANVTEDSDDTSMSYLAILLRKKIHQVMLWEDKYQSLYDDLTYMPDELFDKYLDTNRNNRHWMNYIYGDEEETGAYLTWLGKEYEFKRWKKMSMFGRLFVTLLHNMVFFAPISECFPFAYQPYIPYGANDLCPVVNANVLSCLAAYDRVNYSRGAKNAKKLVSKKIFQGNYDFHGIYYPNRFSLPYTASEAFYRGISDELYDSAMIKLSFDLVTLQNPNGYWVSRKLVNKRDTIQSTVYALNTLLNIAIVKKDISLIPVINKCILWLLQKFHHNKNYSYLKGGIFFSGGTVVRLHLVWTSDALTTALAAKAFVKYKYLIENYLMKCYH